MSGKDKSKTGEVIEIFKSQNMVKVKGINLIKKHEKTTKEKKGGIITKENYIHVSNLKNLDLDKNIKGIQVGPSAQPEKCATSSIVAEASTPINAPTSVP